MFFKLSEWLLVSWQCTPILTELEANQDAVKLPKPKDSEGPEEDNSQKKDDSEHPLPQTLVRIPTEHAPLLQQASTGGANSAE